MPALTVNGRPLEFKLDPQTPLLWALRDGANLTGAKYGCGVGDCGACTVIVDGEALQSCQLTLAAAEGRAVTTIEGLSRGGSHPVQLALVETQAIQCGFCTPGIVMSAAALLARNADPSDDEIKAALTNLCRCGVYPRLVRAVQMAGKELRRAGSEAPPLPPVGGAGGGPANTGAAAGTNPPLTPPASGRGAEGPRTSPAP